MSAPQIRMELDDGTNTWITVVPISLNHIEGQLHYDVEAAAGQAFSIFLRSLIREPDALNEHLLPFHREQRKAFRGDS